jgi:hypothetical protein
VQRTGQSLVFHKHKEIQIHVFYSGKRFNCMLKLNNQFDKGLSLLGYSIKLEGFYNNVFSYEFKFKLLYARQLTRVFFLIIWDMLQMHQQFHN